LLSAFQLSTTNKLTPWSSAYFRCHQQLSYSRISKNFMEPEGLLLTRVFHWSLPWARWIQSIPLHPNYLRSILMLSFHQTLGLLTGFFPSGFSTKIL
jgi:hypothetical protein